MILVTGLGNPGSEYDDTPHNVGFAVVDELARRLGVRFRRSATCLSQEASFSGANRMILMKPQTYMNRSGMAVKSSLVYYRLSPAGLLVVCDDVNLPEGQIRIREKGGAGGQKGLVSIIHVLGTEDFPRIRVGVGGGHPGADVGSHVLRKQTGAQKEKFSEAVSLAADAVQCFLEQGLATAMNRYNVKKSDETRDSESS